MDSKTLLEQLKKEHAELGQAISVLERRVGGSVPTQHRRTHGRVMTAAARKAMSLKLRRVWAAKKKALEARSKASKKAAAKRAA